MRCRRGGVPRWSPPTGPAVPPAVAWSREIARSFAVALDALSAGRDPLLVTASGPDDPAIGALKAAAEASGVPMTVVNDRIGAGLGHALDHILQSAKLERVVVAGG